MLPAPWPDIRPTHIILTLSQPVLPYPNNAKCQAKKRQVSILKLLVRTDEVWILQSPKAGDGPSTHLAVPSDRVERITCQSVSKSMWRPHWQSLWSSSWQSQVTVVSSVTASDCIWGNAHHGSDWALELYLAHFLTDDFRDDMAIEKRVL